jgi:hypothetical protein
MKPMIQIQEVDEDDLALSSMMDNVDDDDDEDIGCLSSTSKGPRARADSSMSKKSTGNRRRKDPFNKTNRFKFSHWEDQLLKT